MRHHRGCMCCGPWAGLIGRMHLPVFLPLDDSKSPHHHSHTHAHAYSSLMPLLISHSTPTHSAQASCVPRPRGQFERRALPCSSSIPPLLPCLVSLGVEEWNEGVTLARSTDQPAAPQDTETWRPTQSLPGDNGQRPTTRSNPLPHVSSLGHKTGKCICS